MKQFADEPDAERVPWKFTRHGAVVVLVVDIQRLFDPDLVDRLDHALRQETGVLDDLIIDVTVVRYVSSAMLGRLVIAWLEAQKRGRRVVLCGVTGTLAEIMHIAGLHQRFEMFQDHAAALAALLGTQP